MQFYEILQRISYLIKGDRRYRYYDKLKQNLSFSRNEMIDYQNQLIQKLVFHAYNKTLYYRDLMDDLDLSPNDIKTKHDLKKLPVLSKSIIRQNIEELKSNDRYSEKLSEDISGGSTGNVAIIYKSPYFIQMSRAAGMRNNLLVDWYPADKSVWIWGAPYEHQQARESLITKIGLLLNRRLLFNAYNYSRKDFPSWVEKIKKFKPKIVYGYASILLEFSEFLIENEISLDSVLKVVSTSETLQERDVIEKGFGCDVFDQYGCREILGIGIESGKNEMLIADDVVALNIGEEGEFLITALHSYGFPLINYKLGDCGVLVESNESENKLPFSKMNLKIGRITDNFLTRDQRTVSGSALGTYISTFKMSVLGYQLIQNDYADFAVKYIPDEGFDFESYKSTLANILTEYFGEDVLLHFEQVDTLPVEKSGKKLMFKRLFKI